VSAKRNMAHETLTAIPTIDIKNFEAGGERRRAFTDLTVRALHDIGFVFVSAPPEVSDNLQKMHDAFEKLFDLPEEQKLKYERKKIHRQRGYTPLNQETGILCRGNDPSGKDDKSNYAENWFIGPEMNTDAAQAERYAAFYSPNVWPAEVPELQEVIEPVRDGLCDVGRSVMRALAKPLGQDPDYFDEMIKDSPNTLFRPLHYPAVTAEQAPNTIGACQHTDINFTTVLPAPTREGLWVQSRAGAWIPGRAPEGHVIVQVGDMLQHVTGGYFLSAQHEVRSPIAQSPDDKGRYSSALFIHPRPDVMLEPILELTEHPEQYQPITGGNFLLKRLAEIGLLGETRA
jgi:isopenicillin N synthase-like dioxygenase